MSDRQDVVDHINLPKTQRETMDKLSSLCEAFSALRDQKLEKGGAISASTNQDWRGLIDFMGYVEKPDGTNVPEIDTYPLTAITAAERYQVVRKNQAEAMRAEFMRQVRAIAGPDLNPAQAKKLFRFFVTHNPTAGLFKNEP